MTGPEVVEQVARYAPTRQSTALEWSSVRASAALEDIIGAARDTAAGEAMPLHFLPTNPRTHRSRWTRLLPIAASVAVLAVAGGIVVAVLPSSRPREAGGASSDSSGPVFDPPAGLSAEAIGDGRISYRVIEQMDLDAAGNRKPDGQDNMTLRDYVDVQGDIVSFRSGAQQGCRRYPAAGGPERFSRDSFAALPTDVDRLAAHLRKQVAGGSSLDEAVFTWVSDALHEADGLASPRLRAALVGVLSRTPGVYLHGNQRDLLDRPALRVDYVNQKTRPGEVQSLYFAPDTFQLLERRDSSNGEPDVNAGPSPAYTAPAGPGLDPATISGAGYADVMRSEAVVTEVPDC